MTNYSRSVLKSNGLRHSKNPPVRFSFSLKIVPATIAKKLPLQLRPKPLFIAFFSLSHKRPTFAFTGESGYTLGFRRRIAHNGLHAETQGFVLATVRSISLSSYIWAKESRRKRMHAYGVCPLPLAPRPRRAAQSYYSSANIALPWHCSSLWQGISPPFANEQCRTQERKVKNRKSPYLEVISSLQ